MKLESYLTVPQFAKTVGISKQAVHKAMKQGRIKNCARLGGKIFIIHKSELKKFEKT